MYQIIPVELWIKIFNFLDQKSLHLFLKIILLYENKHESHIKPHIKHILLKSYDNYILLPLYFQIYNNLDNYKTKNKYIETYTKIYDIYSMGNMSKFDDTYNEGLIITQLSNLIDNKILKSLFSYPIRINLYEPINKELIEESKRLYYILTS